MSILSVMAEIFVKLLLKQRAMFMDQFLLKQCGFWKGNIAQHCPSAIWEIGKQEVDKTQAFVALLTNVSKAFDCLPHILSRDNKSASWNDKLDLDV